MARAVILGSRIRSHYAFTASAGGPWIWAPPAPAGSKFLQLGAPHLGHCQNFASMAAGLQVPAAVGWCPDPASAASDVWSPALKGVARTQSIQLLDTDRTESPSSCGTLRPRWAWCTPGAGSLVINTFSLPIINLMDALLSNTPKLWRKSRAEWGLQSRFHRFSLLWINGQLKCLRVQLHYHCTHSLCSVMLWVNQKYIYLQVSFTIYQQQKESRWYLRKGQYDGLGGFLQFLSILTVFQRTIHSNSSFLFSSIFFTNPEAENVQLI